MHMLRLCLTAAILFSALMGTGFAQDVSDPVRPAKVYTVAGSDSEFRRTYPGIVLPSKEVELSFRVSGRVVELPIRASMRLEEGAVVAQLDQRDFEAQVAQLQSQKDEALARLEVLRTGARPEEIAVLEATVSAAEARLGQARDQFERSRQLAERGVTTTAKLREDESALRVAAAQFEAELEQLAIGRAGGRPEEIAAAEAALRGLVTRIESAQDDLSDTTLRAPFAGIVARRDIENFSNITSGQTVVLMQDISTVDVVFDIPGTDITAILATGAENVKSVVEFDAVSRNGTAGGSGRVFDAGGRGYADLSWTDVGQATRGRRCPAGHGRAHHHNGAERSADGPGGSAFSDRGRARWVFFRLAGRAVGQLGFATAGNPRRSVGCKCLGDRRSG